MLQLTQFTLDHSPDAIYWMKPDGQFIYVNETACRVIGYTRKEMLTMGVSDIDPSLPNGVPLEMMEATKRAGSVRVETQHRTKDGRTIPVEVIVAYMKYKGIEYNCSFVRDITQRKQSVEALKKKTDQLEEAQSIGSIGSWELDIENKLLWTDEIYKIFGLPLGTLPTYDIFMGCVHPDDRKYVEEKWTEAIAVAPYDIDHRLMMNDGSVKLVREKAYFDQDKNGKILKGIGVTQDITIRKKAAEELQQSVALLSSIVNSPTNIIIFVLDKDYNYLSFNNAHSEEIKRLYNASIEVGQNILLYIPREDDRLKAEESYKQVIEGNRFVKIEEHGVGTNRFWYELTFNPIKDTLGQVTGFTVFVTEITDRKRAEEELEHIFNLTPDMLCIASAEGCLLRINHAWEDTLGFSTQELLNKNVMDFIHPDDIESTLAEIERQLNGVETICFENRYICKDGSYKTLAWNTHVEKNGLLYGGARDITEQKKHDEELKKLDKPQSIAVLADGIAHDYNNIMAAIAVNVGLAQTYPDPSQELYDILAAAEKSALRGSALSAQLRTFAGGGVSVKKTGLNLFELINDSANFPLSGTNTLLELKLVDNLWPVEADEGQVRQVIQNLVVNGSKAMPGGGTLTISAKNVEVTYGEIFQLKEGMSRSPLQIPEREYPMLLKIRSSPPTLRPEAWAVIKEPDSALL